MSFDGWERSVFIGKNRRMIAVCRIKMPIIVLWRHLLIILPFFCLKTVVGNR